MRGRICFINKETLLCKYVVLTACYLLALDVDPEDFTFRPASDDRYLRKYTYYSRLMDSEEAMLPDIHTGPFNSIRDEHLPRQESINDTPYDKGHYYLGIALRNNGLQRWAFQPVPGHRVSLLAIGATCFTICAIRLEPRAGWMYTRSLHMYTIGWGGHVLPLSWTHF